MKIRNLILPLAIACASSIAVPASGQSTSTTSAGATAATTPTRDRPQTAPEEGSQTDDNMGTASAYARTGGSLMRAGRGVSAPADPGASQADPRIAGVSFYAVAPPIRRVIQVHDLITVIIKEESESKNEGETKLDKTATLTAAINQFIKLNLGNQSLTNGIGGVTPKIDTTGTESFDGKGSAGRKDSISVRVQATVVDVKPNGTLVLSARKHLRTEDEDMTWLISGQARVEDITTDNSILSTQMYDFDLTEDTKGAVRAASKRGWLPRLLDALNPF